MPELSTLNDVGKRTLTQASIVGLLVAAVLLIWYAADFFLLSFAGVLLAIFLRSLSDPLTERTRLTNGWSLTIVLMVLTLLTTGAGWLMAASLIDQIEQMPQKVSESLEQLERYLKASRWGQRLLSGASDTADGLAGQISLKGVGIYATSVLALFGAMLVILFVGIYLAISPDVYLNGIVRLVPIERRPRAWEILARIGRTLKRWLLARLVSMAAVGVMTTIGLWLLDIPLALTLGLLAGLLSFVPYIGSIAAFVPAALMAPLQGPMDFVWVTLLYISVQTIEGHLLMPVLQWGMIAIPPALTLVVQLVMGLLAGTLGMLLASPLLAAIIVLVDPLYVRDVLGDAGENRDAELEKTPAADDATNVSRNDSGQRR